ncbi:Transcriptional repressor SdpR [Posidoniimonas polymericola]|uniref:Transcriptional repressor SdpR n=1 Tax=Posidoniimonas polymericola TaxID=2528002 RepID=A0A5C5YQF1_9BACT|nr:metalloregulator ArsR/SmtB family transcription factor [Posidoniimonas polymericola]TWT77093.1 Transcriptional repressor SdpR [Posidoniimonas polymericola]
MPDLLSQKFSALADPTRRAMLARLAEGEACVSDLAAPFLTEMSLPAVTKHVKVLEKAGLVEKSRDGQRRPCSLKPEALQDVNQWLEQYRQLWEESLDRLDEYLKSVTAAQAEQEKSNKNAPRTKSDGRKSK